MPRVQFHSCPDCGTLCACDNPEAADCEHAGTDCEPPHPDGCQCDDCLDAIECEGEWDDYLYDDLHDDEWDDGPGEWL